MSSIKTYLENILSAVYGKDVRQAIHDAINQCYIDATIGITPQINVRSITGGHAVDITLGDNTQTFNVMDGNINTAILFNTKTNAPATKSQTTAVTVSDISEYNIIAVRCTNGNIRQMLMFFRVSGSDTQFLLDTSTTYSRGVYGVDWVNNQITVKWDDGNDVTKDFVYFDQVIGIG